MNLPATVFLCAALAGLVALALQRLGLALALRRPAARPSSRPPFSILKPLCGLDEGLEENLLAFATLDYPDYELLLGARSPTDAAWPLAKALAQRFPGRVRAVLQEGEPGLNPKVNQLATLERHARHELLVVADSNTRPAGGYLDELAALFEDPLVGATSNPVSGAGQLSFGALLDNLHLASSVGAGQLAAKHLAGRDLVVGKSMALRRAAIEALGGFAAYADYLAEDYVIGREVTERLKLAVAIAQTPIFNVSVHRSVGSFFRRYVRWGVIHRTAITLPSSLSQGLLNPWPLSLLALALWPSRVTVLGAALVFSLKALLDLSAARRLGLPLGLEAVPAVAIKDVLVFLGWAHGQVCRTVDWRGTRLKVARGSRLVVPAPAPVEVEGAVS